MAIHFYKNDTVIGDGEYVFRRYSLTPPGETKSRFAMYVDGELEELLPEDFGDITTIANHSIINAELFPSEINALTKITVKDSVTKIGILFGSLPSVKEIVYPKNLTTIGLPLVGVQSKILSTETDDTLTFIWDFSNCTTMPTAVNADGLKIDESSSIAVFQSRPNEDTNYTYQILVPTNLYNTWVNTYPWSEATEFIVAK